jgi:hypothetical protein
VLGSKGGSFVTGIIQILADCPNAAVLPGKIYPGPIVIDETARRRALTALAKIESGNN